MRRSLALLLLGIAATALLPGCALIETNKTKLRLSSVRANPADKNSPRDHFVEALGKGRNAGGGALAIAPIELWAPFLVEVSVGVFHPDAREATLGATACLELNDSADLGEPFAFVCADFLQGLTQTRASAPESLLEEHFAVFQVELQLEADGENLWFRSRDREADEWIDVGSVPFTQTSALLPGVSVSDLLKKGRLGFDDLRVERTGVPPGPQGDADTFVAHVENALFRLYEACALLDGANADFGTAAQELDAALGALGDAAFQLPLLAETKATRKAAKRVAQSEKKTRSALAKIGKGKRDPAIKRIQKAMRSGGEAILLIEPRTL